MATIYVQGGLCTSTVKYQLLKNHNSHIFFFNHLIRLLLHLATIFNHDLRARHAAVGSLLLDRLDDIYPLNNFSKHGVLAVEPAG